MGRYDQRGPWLERYRRHRVQLRPRCWLRWPFVGDTKIKHGRLSVCAQKPTAAGRPTQHAPGKNPDTFRTVLTSAYQLKSHWVNLSLGIKPGAERALSKTSPPDLGPHQSQFRSALRHWLDAKTSVRSPSRSSRSTSRRASRSISMGPSSGHCVTAPQADGRCVRIHLAHLIRVRASVVGPMPGVVATLRARRRCCALGWRRVSALFQMFLRTLEEIGADRQELEAALARCTDVGPSFVATFRALAERGGDASYRAVGNALLADWATSEPYEREKNYAIAGPAFEQFARAHQPRIERIDLPFRETALSAYWMTPHATPAAAVLFVPGQTKTTSPKSGWSRWLMPPARVGSQRW